MASAQSSDEPRAPDNSVDLCAVLLRLCAEQIDCAVQDASQEIAQMTDHLLSAAAESRQLQQALESEPPCDEQNARIAQHGSQISESASLAALKLQYEDRMRQRLENVRRILERIADKATTGRMSGAQWQELLVQIRSEYSTELEREMLDKAIAGTAIGDPQETDNVC